MSVISVSFRQALLYTTALMATAALAAPTPAVATTYKVPPSLTTTLNLNTRDSLKVKNSGSISVSSSSAPAVSINNVVAGTVTNSGLISSGNFGISLLSHADLAGGITNRATGTISGVNAIQIRSFSGVSGGIDNRGLISGDLFGIHVFSGSDVAGGITNRGGGTISGTLAIGVSSLSPGLGSDVSGGIVNNGLISGYEGITIYRTGDVSGGIVNSAHGTIDVGSIAIAIRGSSDVSGGIINRGTMNADSSAVVLISSDISGGLFNAGALTGGRGIYLALGSDISGGVENAAGGLINGAGVVSGSGTAFQLRLGSDISGGIINSGTILGFSAGIYLQSSNISGGIVNKAGGVVEANNGDAILLGSGSDISGVIDNSGQILGHNNGIDILTSGLSGGIVNRSGGVISGSVWAGVHEQGGLLSGGIDNSGTIYGGLNGIDSAGGDISGGIINRAGGVISGGVGIGVSNGDISGGIENHGTITGNRGIHIAGGGVSGGITIEAGGLIEGIGGTAINMSGLGFSTPILINGGRIIGDVEDDTPSNGFSLVTIGGNFATEGSFNVSSLGISSGKSLTISATNQVTLDHMPTSTGATLKFGINSVTDYGKLTVTIGAIDMTGLTVQAGVGAGAVLADGEELKVGDGTATIIGGPGGVKTAITDNSLLWAFTMADGTAAAAPTDDTDLFFFVTQASALTSSQQLTLTALQRTAGSDGAVLQNAIDNVNNSSTQRQLNAAFSSLAPVIDGHPQMAAQDFSDHAFDIAGDHIDSFWNGGDQNPVQSYSESSAGISSFGYQAKLMNDAVIGVNVSNGKANDNGKADYQVTFYGDRELGGGHYLRGMAAYAYSDTETERHDVGGAGGPTAQARFGADEYVVRLEAGRRYHFANAFMTPSLSLDWMHYVPDDYTETGAGDASLTVRQSKFDTLGVSAGFKTSWTYAVGEGSRFTPGFRAGYRRDLLGDNIRASSTFAAGGNAFTTEGTSPSRDRLSFGIGFGYATASDLNIQAGYDVDARAGDLSQTGNLRARFRF
ncbi:MAG: autotransporter outer membrane beta-barrel domain-containing protein [Alphaproteobacteria bacterium]|nr:MAG: autotransporter outer membrane beta-barrel domain-containing protein [Alphaproteobacteria bacterium]